MNEQTRADFEAWLDRPSSHNPDTSMRKRSTAMERVFALHAWQAATEQGKRQPQTEGDAKDAPYKAIESILNEVMDIAVSNGANSISMPNEYVEVAWWLCNQKPIAAIASQKAAHKITTTPQGNL